ncbi:MAG: M48 family metallopeptidase, partial [Planctomycetota bacterium]|nr:M48 family metallopeptidase [Planctomycetota bacterium]
AGLWVRICWRTEPLPEGDLRRRLDGLAERADVRVGNVLVWRTNNTMANGAMIGMIGPFRYIMITDALLLAMSAAPEEVEAVFAHEIAHVKYRHTLLYCGLLVGAVSATFLAGEAVAAISDISWAPDAAGGVVLLGYLAMVFGYISRRCELEADLYAVRSTECPAGCSPPSCGYAAGEASPGAEDWAASPYGTGLCVHRIMALAAALQRIARLNGLAQSARGWRHFSIARRVEVLEGLVADPAGVVRYERRIRRLKRVALAVSLALAVVAGVYNMLVPPSEADDPEHPTRPEHVIPGEPMYYTRFVDRNQVDELALRPPELHGDADASPHLDDGRLAGLRGDAAAADDQVAVADARAHAVAVDAQGERARAERREAR